MTLDVAEVGAERGTRMLRPVGLDELMAVAALQTRIDRKYVVPLPVAETVLELCSPRLAPLEIDGRRAFTYESVYFDTDDLRSYLAAAHGRRRRYKVRTRCYVETQTCALEVKRRGGRDETVKDRIACPAAALDAFTHEGARFIDTHLGQGTADALHPSLTTSYRRRTFLDVEDGARITCDTGVTFTALGGCMTTLRDLVIIETKATSRPTRIDRALWSTGHRPEAFSKYCVGLASLRPDLPASKWNRGLRDRFGWQPSREEANRGRAPGGAGAA
jgi:hypothetical protein